MACALEGFLSKTTEPLGFQDSGVRGVTMECRGPKSGSRGCCWTALLQLHRSHHDSIAVPSPPDCPLQNLAPNICTHGHESRLPLADHRKKIGDPGLCRVTAVHFQSHSFHVEYTAPPYLGCAVRLDVA